MIMLKAFIGFLLVVVSSQVQAQNPLFKGYADPAMTVHDGKMYILVGKDKSPTEKDFIMPYWSIFSSSDLMNWTKECDIDPKDTYLGAGYNYCWAGDISFKNGKVYVYFSEHGEASGVVVADKPSGPFIDVLKKSLLPKEMSINKEYDPTVFADDDGNNYLIFGRDGRLGNNLLHYQIVKLNKDMISLAEPPHDLISSMPNGFGTIIVKKKKEGVGNDSTFIAQDHQYFHKHNGIYYLSRDVSYETSNNILGPYSNRRMVGKNAGHASYSEFNGQTYNAWEFTCEPFGNRVYRQVMMTYLHYKDNGDMVSDANFIQGGKYYTTGVGNYSATWDTIQAEWYFNKSTSVVKKDCPNGGFEIQNLTNKSFLNFPNTKDLKANATINFNISSVNGSGKIEVRKDSPSGTLLGTCNIPKTGSSANYQMAPCTLKNNAETTNLFFVFKGAKGELARLDYFNFSK